MDAAEPPDEHLSRLMARAQQGDQDAYVTLLRAITPRVRQLVRRKRAFLGESDVEDVVQEVLLSIHAVRATYDPDAPFMPWLSAIVRHRLADAGRQHARQGAHEIRRRRSRRNLPGSRSEKPRGDVWRSGGVGTGDSGPAAGTAAGGRIAQVARAVAERGLGGDGVEHRCAEDRDASGDGVFATGTTGNEPEMKTDDLIDRLGRDATVAKPLPTPGRRAAVWLLWGAIYLIVFAVMMFAVMSSPRLIATPLYLLQQGAALVTGIMAARAALVSVIPGAQNRVWGPPLVSAALWIACVALGSGD